MTEFALGWRNGIMAPPSESRLSRNGPEREDYLRRSAFSNTKREKKFAICWCLGKGVPRRRGRPLDSQAG